MADPTASSAVGAGLLGSLLVMLLGPEGLEYAALLCAALAGALWPAQRLPLPGQRDAFGGWTLAAPQKWWGHKAEKETWFYVVGCEPRDQPDLPLVLGEASHVVQSRKREDYRPHITKAEREHTPPELARWLVDLARRCKPANVMSASSGDL